jgi:AcrR family transcriptional regulator
MVADDAVLTARQAERRQRVVRAALELAAEGGYDAVQMRDVAQRASVALGTIYHYFSSKNHLLAASLVEWTRQFEQSVHRHPPVGVSTLERLVDVLGRFTSGMRSHERLSAAIITGFASPGEDNAKCQLEVHEVFQRAMFAAFEPDFDAEQRRIIVRSLEHVWFSGLIGWTNGWMTLDQAIAELHDAARLLVDRD